MQFHIEDVSPVEKKVAVEIPWDRVREKLDAAFKELGKSVQLRGFRKGKVPRSVLERMFRRQVEEEVAKELVQESFIQVASEQKLDAVAAPTIEEATLKNNEPFKYTAKLEVRAPVELKEWSGLPGERVKAVVTDDEVARNLEHKRVMHTEFRAIEGRETLADTDVAILEMKGKIGEHKVDRPEVSVDLSTPEHEPLPGLAKALLGVSTSAKDHPIELEIPADATPAEIAGTKAHLKVTVKDARQKHVPALDDDLAKDTGEADTLDELRTKIRAGLEKAAKDRAEKDMREKLVKELVKRNPIPVAGALVERGIDTQLQRARLSLAMQGLDLDQAGVDLGAMREKLRDSATEEIRGQLLLEAIADGEKLEVTEADVDAKIAELATAQRKPAHKVKAEMDREGTLDTLRWRLRQDKALDLVVARATITDTEPTPAGAEATK
jgi:trigger factor